MGFGDRKLAHRLLAPVDSLALYPLDRATYNLKVFVRQMARGNINEGALEIQDADKADSPTG